MHELRFSVGRIPQVGGADWGTCFFVQPGNLVVTCEHVAKNAVRRHGRVAIDIAAPEVDGVAPLPERIWAGPKHADALIDLAILEVDDLPGWLCPLSLQLNPVSHAGRRVVSYGYPEDRPHYGAPAKGTITGDTWDPVTRQRALEIHSLELTGGFSGAPIVDDANGLVIGIMSATVTPDSRGRFAEHAWAIPAVALTRIFPAIKQGEHPLSAELRRVALERVPGLVDFGLYRVAEVQPMAVTLSLEDELPGSAPLSPKDVLDRALSGPGCLLVCGPGGAGKSTLLRSVYAPLLAEPTLQGPPGTVPVYFTARDWHATSGGTDEERLAQAIQKQKHVRYPHDRLETELPLLLASKTSRLVFMIDAVDEILDGNGRLETLKDIRDLAAKLAPTHRVIVSSRRIEELFILGDAKAVWVNVQPVQHDSVKSYFCAALGVPKGCRLATEFARVEGVAATGSPMLAAMALSIALEGAELPRSIVRIFDTYLSKHSQRSRARQGQAVRSFSDEEMQFALQELAFGSIDEQLSGPAAIQALVRAGRNGGMPAPVASAQVAELATLLLDALLETHFALVREGDALRWAHQSLRDYFVARRLTHEVSADTNLWRSCAAKWQDENWRSAIRFTLLMASESAELKRDLLVAIPPFDGGQPNDASLSFFTECIEAGACFARDVLVDIVDVAVLMGLSYPVQYKSCAGLFRSTRHPLEQLMRIRFATPHANDRLLELLTAEQLALSSRTELAYELLN